MRYAINREKLTMKRFLLSAAAAAVLASAGAAHAAATQVNFGFIPLVPQDEQIEYVGPSLSSSTSIDFGSSTFLTNTVGSAPPFQDDAGSFTGMPVLLSASILNYIIGQTVDIELVKTFETGGGGADGSEGLYTAMFSTVIAQGGSGNLGDFVNLTFQGTVNGPNGFTAPDVMLLNCNQSGGGDAAVNCSFTQEGPPFSAQVSEPATLSLVALSLVGMMAAARRRRSSQK